MKRLVPIVLVLSLALLPAHAPAASAPSGLSQQQATELLTSYDHLTTEFYKKVNRQVVLDGMRTNLLAYLKAHGVAKPTLPVLHASSDDADKTELAHEVSAAIAAYADVVGEAPAKTVESIDPATKKVVVKTTVTGPFKKYGPKLGATNINYAAIAGTLNSVKDRYTVFLSPKDFSDLNEGLDGTKFGGIGISYDIDDTSKLIHVQNVILEGPAEKAGLLTDDVISAVNGQSVHDLLVGKSVDAQTNAVKGLLRGDPGTKVQLTIVRGSKPLPDPVSITREVIQSPSVYSKLLPNDIGWIQLTVFGLDTAHELTTALTRLEAQGAKAYVLDLRYNGGGYLNTAVDVSSKFISSGPIVTVESRAGSNTEYDAENEAIPPRPLVVLVNNYTASASEITAGAIQDSGVGTLMGVKTFGKGVVQSIYPLGDGSAVKITTARYVTPHGHDINHIGITPDVLATIPKDAKIRLGDLARDPQLQQAVTFLQGKIAQAAP